MHKNLIIISDTYTRFEGTSIGTSVALETKNKFMTANTFYTSVDPSSLSDIFVKINSIRDSYVFLCINTDILFKKIKVSSYIEEISNLCKNIVSIGCTPILCLNFFNIEDQFKKRKARHLEKGLVKSCNENNHHFLRINLFEKNDYFFSEQGKMNLVQKISDFCLKIKKGQIKNNVIVADNRTAKEISNTDKSIVIRKSRRVIV